MSSTPVPVPPGTIRSGGNVRARYGARVRAVAIDAGEADRALGHVAALLGLAFGLVAFAFEPLVLGAVGITLGLVGKHTGSAFGRTAVVVAMLATILGPTFGEVVQAFLAAG
jgi:hypothetical protein